MGIQNRFFKDCFELAIKDWYSKKVKIPVNLYHISLQHILQQNIFNAHAKQKIKQLLLVLIESIADRDEKHNLINLILLINFTSTNYIFIDKPMLYVYNRRLFFCFRNISYKIEMTRISEHRR